MEKVLQFHTWYNFRPAIKEAASSDLPIWGTCAGLILMANDLKEDIPNPLSLMNINVSRNAYGRQIDSFKDLYLKVSE